MAILADTLKKLLTKAGFDINSESYRELIGKKELMVEVSDDIETSLTSLMGLTEAKNNIDIKKHYKAEVLDPFNNKLPIWLKELGADDEMIKAISEDANTYNKVEVALKKIAELKSKANDSGNKGDKAALEQKINELGAQLSKITTDAAKDKDDAVAAITNRYENEFTELEIIRMLGTKQLPGQFSQDVEIKLGREFLNQKLAEKNASIKKVDGKLRLVAKDDEKMFIFDNGKELDLSTLTDMALADNKFLKVSDNGGGMPPRSTQGGTPPKTNAATENAVSQIDDMLAKFQ